MAVSETDSTVLPILKYTRGIVSYTGQKLAGYRALRKAISRTVIHKTITVRVTIVVLQNEDNALWREDKVMGYRKEIER